jgi:hypothetical protein
MSEMGELLSVLGRADRSLITYEAAVFREADQLVIAMLPGQITGLKGVWFRLTNAPYRAAYKRAIELRRGVKASESVVFRETNDAQVVREKSQHLSQVDAMPKAVQEREALDAVYQTSQKGLSTLGTLRKLSWEGMELGDLTKRAAALSLDNGTPYRLGRLYEIENELFSLGAQRLVDEIRTSRRPADEWAALFQHVWLKSTLDPGS